MNYEAEKAHEAWLRYSDEMEKRNKQQLSDAAAWQEKQNAIKREYDAMLKEQDNPLMQTAEYLKERDRVFNDLSDPWKNAYLVADPKVVRYVDLKALANTSSGIAAKNEDKFKAWYDLEKLKAIAKPNSDVDIAKLNSELEMKKLEAFLQEAESRGEVEAKKLEAQYGQSNKMKELLLKYLEENPEVVKSLLNPETSFLDLSNLNKNSNDTSSSFLQDAENLTPNQGSVQESTSTQNSLLEDDFSYPPLYSEAKKRKRNLISFDTLLA